MRRFTIIKRPDPASVLGRWVAQYPTETDERTVRLKALVTPTAEQIEEIIGNRSWTRIACDCCRSEAELLIGFGEDYEVKLCARCLTDAGTVLEAIEAHK